MKISYVSGSVQDKLGTHKAEGMKEASRKITWICNYLQEVKTNDRVYFSTQSLV